MRKLSKFLSGNTSFKEVISEYFRLETLPFLSIQRSQFFPSCNWLQSPQNESLSVVPAGVEPSLIKY